MTGIFTKASIWLLARAIQDCDLSKTLSIMADWLIGAGIPLYRIAIGRGLARGTLPPSAKHRAPIWGIMLFAAT